MGVKLPVSLFNWHKPLSDSNFLTVIITTCYLKYVHLWHLCEQKNAVKCGDIAHLRQECHNSNVGIFELLV